MEFKSNLVKGLVVILIAIILFVTIDYLKEKNGRGDGSSVDDSRFEKFEKHVSGPKVVTKIIDGDTIIIEGESVRLLGVDADEKGYPCYNVAKKRLEEFLLNKEVYLEYFNEDRDSYGRMLRYIILNGENINLKLVREGDVIARVSDDPYKDLFIEAEREARENRMGCKWNNTFSESLRPANLRNLNDSIYACDAKNYIGEEKIVEGTVVDIGKSKTNTTFLNFEKPYPYQCFTAVILSSSLNNFQDVNIYKNKIVKVKGIIKEYKGKPEIILENQEQIEIIK
ncbi:MAG: thermonuclease family protein [Candidatus Pacearchaeota archaeon]